MLDAIVKILKAILWDGFLSKIVTRTGDKISESVSEAVADRVDRALGKQTGDSQAPDAGGVVPKGLRSFDEHDAGFFLQLLPGPYRDDGLPESIHFWKTRIEESDRDKAFRVGVLYGPSGCGKSSLVKAGVLPRLSAAVTSIYVEATPTTTADQLLAELKKHCAYLNAKTSLRAALRRKEEIPAGKKVLLVIDQFEQWLHGKADDEFKDLVEALSECDGERLQCLLLVRDDFWTPLSRFMRQMGIPQEEGKNTALVDLFDKRHAKKVLALFGQAYGALPSSANPSGAQGAFLDQAVDGLAQQGRIICVRLALFADMVSHWEWIPGTLKRLGGLEGVGVAFLEQSLAAKTAPAAYRQHQRAARAVLKALLPEQGTEIKGAMRPKSELLRKSGYARRVDDFAALLNILDHQLRLITPAGSPPPPEEEAGSRSAPGDEPYYQLTHDYLVPSLHRWLTLKQRETRRGRAELCLAERSEMWTAAPENRHLPSLPEYVTVRSFTRRRDWSDPQRKMMGRATRYHATRTAIWLIVLCIGALIIREVFIARDITTKILAANPSDLPSRTAVRPWLRPLVKRDLVAELERKPSRGYAEEDRNRLFRRQANAAVALTRLGQADRIWNLFEDNEYPTGRSYLITRYGPSGGDPHAILARLKTEKDDSRRRGLILAMAGCESQAEFRAKASPVLLDLYENDPDAGIHSAAEYVLKQWKQEERLKAIDQKLATGRIEGDRQWFLTEHGDTMVIIPKPDKPFLMGSPRDEPGRSQDETQHPRTIGRRYAIAAKEVTVEQYLRFCRVNGLDDSDEKEMRGNLPVAEVSWYRAAAYCNWLSEQQGLAPCYGELKLEDFEDGMDLPQDLLRRNGYRLPTEAEWEYACRAGTHTRYCFGNSDELLSHYAWYQDNSGGASHPVGTRLPNMWGPFDMHGNAWEWCLNEYAPYPTRQANDDDVSGTVRDLTSRVLRGGSFLDFRSLVRSPARYNLYPDVSWDFGGFRVARTYD